MDSETSFHLEHHFIQYYEVIEAWFSEQWNQIAPPLFTSVDLRRATFKWAAVDLNFFPAGFNNLPEAHTQHFRRVLQAAFARWYPGIRKILIIPENHTRNGYYFESLGRLQNLLEEAGFIVRLGSLVATSSLVIPLASGKSLVVAPILPEGKLRLGDFEPDAVLLNNDLSEGLPKRLAHSTQTILPPAAVGWFARSKTHYFGCYAEVADALSQQISIDSWCLQPYFAQCENLDFMAREGVATLEAVCEALLSRIKQKYAEHGIKNSPFLVIKADQGTYGMAVMTIKTPSEVRALNRKKRTYMSSSKGGNRVTRVLVQEGVPSIDQQPLAGEQFAVSEPVVYTAGDRVLGGFYRIHPSKGAEDSLNTPGMTFAPWPFSEKKYLMEEAKPTDALLYGYRVMARLAVLAAAKEQAAYV